MLQRANVFLLSRSLSSISDKILYTDPPQPTGLSKRWNIFWHNYHFHHRSRWGFTLYHTALTHHFLTHHFKFLTFGRSGAQSWAPERSNVKNLKRWVRPVWCWSLRTAAIWNSWRWRGYCDSGQSSVRLQQVSLLDGELKSNAQFCPHYAARTPGTSAWSIDVFSNSSSAYANRLHWLLTIAPNTRTVQVAQLWQRDRAMHASVQDISRF